MRFLKIDLETKILHIIECGGPFLFTEYIRIEFHILSLPWMMRNICFFKVSEKPFRLHRYKKAEQYSHHPLQAQNLNYNP